MSLSRLIAVFALLIAGSALSQKPKHSEAPQKKIPSSRTFTAVFRGRAFVAWTGDENEALKRDQLEKLAQERVNNICNFFGFKSGSVEMDSITQSTPMIPASDNKNPRSVPRKYAYLALEDGELTLVEDPDQGSETIRHLKVASIVLVGSVDLARYFNTITCYR